jgi:hypothetical protein
MSRPAPVDNCSPSASSSICVSPRPVTARSRLRCSAEISRFADARGWEVTAWFEDLDVSGRARARDKREGLNELFVRALSRRQVPSPTLRAFLNRPPSTSRSVPVIPMVTRSSPKCHHRAADRPWEGENPVLVTGSPRRFYLQIQQIGGEGGIRTPDTSCEA